MSLWDLTVPMWYTRYMCIAVLLLWEVQQVQVKMADGVLSRDFEVHTLCNPGSLLAVLLQLSSHWWKLFISLMSAVNLSSLLYTGPLGCPTTSGPSRVTVVSKLWMLLLSISVSFGSCKDTQTTVQGVACTSMVGSHSMHFMCGSASLLSVSNLP